MQQQQQPSLALLPSPHIPPQFYDSYNNNNKLQSYYHHRDHKGSTTRLAKYENISIFFTSFFI
jgi:hypothetical protein